MAGRDCSLFGMGIASQDVTGDGYPEVYLTSQGDNKLQTLADGPARPIYRGHRAAPRRDRPPAVRRRRHQAVDGLDPVFADVNNDGLSDLFVTKGNVEGADGVRDEGPEQPPHRSARWHVRGGRGGCRTPGLRPGPRRRRRRPQLRWGPGHRDRRPARERPAVAQRRHRHRERARGHEVVADRALAGRRPRPGRPEPRRDRGMGRGPDRRADGAAKRSRSVAAMPAAAWARFISAWAGRTRRRCRSPGPMARSGRGWTSSPTGSCASSAARPRPNRGHHDAGETGAMSEMRETRKARVAHVRPPRLRGTGSRAGHPVRALCDASRTAASARQGARVRPARRLRRPGTQRQPRVPYGVRPTVRGGTFRHGARGRAGDPRRQRVLGHGRRRAPADAATSLPGLQPAEPATRSVAAPQRDPGRGGDREGVAGRRDRMEDLRGSPGQRLALVSWSTNCAGRPARTAPSRTPPTS